MATDEPVASPLGGRAALVTGGAVRVGAEIVRALAGAGSRVAIHHRRSRRAAEDLAGEIGRAGGAATVVEADLASAVEIATLFDELDRQGFVPDIVVNSASNFFPSPLDRPDLPGWEEAMAVNLTAPYLVAMHAVARLGDREGDIINIADVYGMRPMRRYIAYSVSKAGLVMLTRSLAQSLAPRIRVNAVAPGPVLLPETYTVEERERAVRRTLLGREGSPADVAGAVLFLLTGTRYATGSVITVDGGRRWS